MLKRKIETYLAEWKGGTNVPMCLVTIRFQFFLNLFNRWQAATEVFW